MSGPEATVHNLFGFGLSGFVDDRQKFSRKKVMRMLNMTEFNWARCQNWLKFFLTFWNYLVAKKEVSRPMNLICTITGRACWCSPVLYLCNKLRCLFYGGNHNTALNSAQWKKNEL